MGTYSEWDEDKKLEFLTKELKGKRPLVPSSIEVSLLYLVAVLCGFNLIGCTLLKILW